MRYKRQVRLNNGDLMQVAAAFVASLLISFCWLSKDNTTVLQGSNYGALYSNQHAWGEPQTSISNGFYVATELPMSSDHDDLVSLKPNYEALYTNQHISSELCVDGKWYTPQLCVCDILTTTDNNVKLVDDEVIIGAVYEKRAQALKPIHKRFLISLAWYLVEVVRGIVYIFVKRVWVIGQTVFCSILPPIWRLFWEEFTKDPTLMTFVILPFIAESAKFGWLTFIALGARMIEMVRMVTLPASVRVVFSYFAAIWMICKTIFCTILPPIWRFFSVVFCILQRIAVSAKLREMAGKVTLPSPVRVIYMYFEDVWMNVKNVFCTILPPIWRFSSLLFGILSALIFRPEAEAIMRLETARQAERRAERRVVTVEREPDNTRTERLLAEATERDGATYAATLDSVLAESRVTADQEERERLETAAHGVFKSCLICYAEELRIGDGLECSGERLGEYTPHFFCRNCCNATVRNELEMIANTNSLADDHRGREGLIRCFNHSDGCLSLLSHQHLPNCLTEETFGLYSSARDEILRRDVRDDELIRHNHDLQEQRDQHNHEVQAIRNAGVDYAAVNQAQNRRAREIAEEEQRTNAFYNQETLIGTMKRCPGCQVLILKNGGCDHMHCRGTNGCNRHFCFACNAMPSTSSACPGQGMHHDFYP